MARRWKCGLVALVACLPRQASSFFACPSLPGAISRPARTTTATAAAGGDDTSAEEGSAAAAATAAATPVKVPRSLDRSAPCSWIAKNNVTFDGDFIASREGEPTAAELTNENLLKVVAQKGSDEEVNWLLWKCLGYRYDADKDAWKAVSVFPRWEEKYPEPVDLLGVTRTYEKETDEPILSAVQFLTRSVPSEHKRCIVEQLKPLGFTGMILNDLTPNRTRRAQMTNFLLYYRDNLWGVPLEEVERRRAERQAKEAAKDEAAKAAKAAAEAQQQQQQSSTDKQ